ncbi:MAG TPA: pitrilysin family protein [Solirubrobacteraceae bacterium]|nr:pitrilysin family protein [Solirubrobacteraceae bacterium]
MTTLSTATDGGAPGVRVVTERVPSVRSVALGFWIATGSVAERDSEAGISHLLEHMLFRGTEHFGSEEIDQIFDAMGAEINAGTDKEATSVYSRVLDHHLPRAFEVIGEMVFQPRFGELETEREVVLEEIAMYEDDPQDKVFDVLGEAVFGAHPLGRAVIGTAEVVGAVTLEQLAAFHAARYRPQEIVIAAAGSVDHDALVELAETLDIAPPPSASAAEGAAALDAVVAAELDAPNFERRVRFAEKDTEQYHVCLGGAGLARGDERRFALRVLEGVLGATSSSRLFQEVRERRGLAYSVFCFSNMYARAGEVGLYVGTRQDNLAEALSVIAAELERCVETPASATELDRSRENLKGRVVLAMESTGARMSHLGGSLLHEMPILSMDEVIERIDAVTLGDLEALAAELFAPDRLSIACVGPDGQAFEAAIEPFAASSDAPAPVASAATVAPNGDAR